MSNKIRRQYPEVGEEIKLNLQDGTSMPVLLDYYLGAARMFQGRNPDGDIVVLALQPDGSWWIVRNAPEDEGDNDHPW